MRIFLCCNNLNYAKNENFLISDLNYFNKYFNRLYINVLTIYWLNNSVYKNYYTKFLSSVTYITK